MFKELLEYSRSLEAFTALVAATMKKGQVAMEQRAMGDRWLELRLRSVRRPGYPGCLVVEGKMTLGVVGPTHVGPTGNRR